MNNQGFSTVLTVIGLLILIPILLLTFHGISVSNQKRQISDQIDALHIPREPETTQCDGDGIDSSPWCEYRYAADITVVEKALVSAGYTEDTSSRVQGSTEHRYVGGSSKILFKVSTSDGMTLLYGERSQ